MWPRWRHALALASARGVLCFGPDRGRKVTYARLRNWLPDFEPDEAGHSLAWLVSEFLTSYGPATARQFGQWLGAPRRWADELFATLAPELCQVDLDGQTAWWPAGHPLPAGEPDGARLLPYFDPYVVGCRPRQRLFAADIDQRALNRTGQAGTLPVLLIDGVVGGIWHQRKAGRVIEVTVEPFLELTKAQYLAVAEQAERLGQFRDCPCRLTLATVTTRFHL